MLNVSWEPWLWEMIFQCRSWENLGFNISKAPQWTKEFAKGLALERNLQPYFSASGFWGQQSYLHVSIWCSLLRCSNNLSIQELQACLCKRVASAAYLNIPSKNSIDVFLKAHLPYLWSREANSCSSNFSLQGAWEIQMRNYQLQMNPHNRLHVFM